MVHPLLSLFLLRLSSGGLARAETKGVIVGFSFDESGQRSIEQAANQWFFLYLLGAACELQSRPAKDGKVFNNAGLLLISPSVYSQILNGFKPGLC